MLKYQLMKPTVVLNVRLSSLGLEDPAASNLRVPTFRFNGNNHYISEVLKHFLSFSNHDNSFTQEMAE